MSNPFPGEDPTLDAAIAAAFSTLANIKVDEEGYKTAVANLTSLYDIKNAALQHYQDAEEFEYEFNLKADAQHFEQQNAEKPFYMRVDPNTVVTVVGNIFIGLAVIKYEQTGVISSKVMSFMKKI